MSPGAAEEAVTDLGTGDFEAVGGVGGEGKFVEGGEAELPGEIGGDAESPALEVLDVGGSCLEPVTGDGEPLGAAFAESARTGEIGAASGSVFGGIAEDVDELEALSIALAERAHFWK